MVHFMPFSVLLAILGLHVSSVLSVTCYDIFFPYDCYSGTCCNGLCCLTGDYCCGTAQCCNVIPAYPEPYLTTGAIAGIIVGSVLLGIALISGLIWLCCICCRSPRTGRVLNSPPQYVQQPYVQSPYGQQPYVQPQYVQQPYDVNSHYDQMVQQPYPTQVQYPTTTTPQVQQHRTENVDNEQQRRQPERPRRQPSVPRGQY